MNSKFFWKSAERMIGQWHICDWCNETNQPINEGNRLATIGDAIDYLGYDQLSGTINQFVRPHGRIRITDRIIVHSHLQLNVAGRIEGEDGACLIAMDAMASLTGDFPYGLVKVQGFVVEKIEKVPAAEFVYTQ